MDEKDVAPTLFRINSLPTRLLGFRRNNNNNIFTVSNRKI